MLELYHVQKHMRKAARLQNEWIVFQIQTNFFEVARSPTTPPWKN